MTTIAKPTLHLTGTGRIITTPRGKKVVYKAGPFEVLQDVDGVVEIPAADYRGAGHGFAIIALDGSVKEFGYMDEEDCLRSVERHPDGFRAEGVVGSGLLTIENCGADIFQDFRKVVGA